MEDIFIRQREPEEDLYRRLQQQSIERLQALSGELWTDYNAHDPGVTMTDLLNYALSELDYRLRFSIPDYLTAGVFQPARYGLFSPLEVFPTAPVTVTDYRKLLIDAVEEIANLWIYPSEEEGRSAGWYDILVELVPGVRWGEREKVEKKVRSLFNRNRNLCEGLAQVLFVERKPLILQGEIGIETGADVSQLLASVYWETLQFFISGVRYRKLEELLAAGKTLDELFDGPCLEHWVIDDESLKALPCRYPVSHLYHRLISLEGVKNIRSLGFCDEGGRIYSDVVETERADRSFTVLIPDIAEQTGIRFLVGDTLVTLDFSHLQEMLYARYARCYGDQNRTTDTTPFTAAPEGVSRDIYTYASVQNDFPECYGINSMGVASGASVQRKAQARQLKSYLLLFDEVLGRGTKELENITQLLDVNGKPLEEVVVPVEIPGASWPQFVDNGLPETGTSTRFLREWKHWTDMLDRMYGEDSYPAWLNAYNFYDSGETEILQQRFRFLRRVPEWGRDRFKGIDLTRNFSANVPGIKAYVSTLLGFEMCEERPVVNVFPMYNLKLVDDDRFVGFQERVLSHDLIPEDVLRKENMEIIPFIEKELTDADFRDLRQRLPLLHYNVLFEGLFHGGIRLENYRLLNLPLQPDRLLLFYHVRKKQWVNLGRFASRRELIETANGLRRFLVMMNRKSETLYVVEHLHLFTEENTSVTVVLPGWSARMADARFREACETLVCSRLPAHLNIHFRWYSLRDMWRFEQAYYDWRKECAAGGTGREAAEKLKKVIL